EVYRQTVNNLCPNTYYEFSAWIRNICPNCGIDSAGSATYRPGVLPNLTFTLDSLDYYNSGEVDTLGWLKKGFVFKTATSQTSATFTIRNNSQGGGGNDWTLDDIAIATCLPSMQYSPSITPMVCRGNPLIINDTVRSYFNNYTFYKWQRSVNAGSSWTDVTPTTTATLTFNGTLYQFLTSDTIPASQTLAADSGDLYRVIVATSNPNLLNSGCLFTDASTIITLKVLNCGPVLGVDLLSFSGKINNGNAELLWITSKETSPVYFNVEKSTDGVHFVNIGTVKGYGNASENNYYHFTDPSAIIGRVYYRIAIYDNIGFKRYSRIISLDGNEVEFALNNVINPFNNELDFEILAPQNSRVEAVITNLLGKPVRKQTFTVYEGVNSLNFQDTQNLPAGMYILQIKYNDQFINKKVMKK
ncbi:MAG TPA: T9SS type A sorting domain-containing protein, partial [Chitinophagaceae bacterium]|nr:T9SS type A sorting domain-containing protein [Chitinophagaceae bacterium]